ncbi:MAG: hypothetical protein J6M12_00340 [Clostridia bacterium]|nr:hypothetical protein [Clostridia bacterium]
MPKNNRKAILRTLVFTLVAVALLGFAEGSGELMPKNAEGRVRAWSALQEVISWIVPT